MLLRATENALAAHIWPEGRYLPTPAEKHFCNSCHVRVRWQHKLLTQRFYTMQLCKGKAILPKHSNVSKDQSVV